MSDILSNFTSAASDQLSADTGAEAFAIPSYLKGADNHQVASGGFSLTSPETWGDAAGDVGRFALSASVRAVTSVYNIVPEAVNWLGGTAETADTYNVIAKLDQNLAGYYAENEAGVNIVGDIAASFIPGMAGVKVLNYGQKALAAASAGKSGFNMAAHIGLLPSKATVIGIEEGKQMAAASQTFTFLNANVMKSIGAGYAQSTLESAAFLGASQVAMQNSPLFEKQDVSDLVWNSLGGGLVGGAVMGSLAVARTYGAVKTGIKQADRILNPASLYTATMPTASSTDKLILALSDIYHPPVLAHPLPAGAAARESLIAAHGAKLTERESRLMNIIYTETNNLVKDEQLARVFAESLKSAPYEVAVSNIEHLAGISRAGAAEKTAVEKLFERVTTGFGKPGEVAPNLGIQYVKLSGENAFQVSHDAPVVLNLADTLKGGSHDSVTQQINSFVGKQKFKVGDSWTPALADSHLETEARYIWAQSKQIKQGMVIGDRDVPMLERAMQSGVSDVQLTSGKILHSDEMLDHIQRAKTKEAWLLAEAYPKMTTEEIAKRVNMRVSALEGDQNTVRPLTDWVATDYSTKAYLNPTYAKLAYDTKPMMDTSGFVMDAVTHAKANQLELRQAAGIAFAQELPEMAAVLPKQIGDKAIYEAYRFGAGGGFGSTMNENYGTIGSIMQDIGAKFNGLKTKLINSVDEKFQSLNYAILNNQEASDDIVKAYNLVLGSPEKYTLSADGMLRMSKVEAAMAKGDGKFPALLDVNSPIEIPIKSQAARDWITAWMGHNDEKLASTSSRLGYQLGTPSQDLRGHLYIPPPDPKNYNHFAFVVDPTVTGTGHVRMIHGADAHALEQLAGKVRAQPGLKVIMKGASEDFHKAMQDYQYGLGINENYINTALARTGVSAPYFAVTDANKILSEVMDWRKRADVSNAREWMKLKYAPEVESLGQLAKSYDELALSKKAYSGKFASDVVKNPYKNLVNTMLDVSTKEEYPIWTPLNRMLENGVSRLVGRLHDAALEAPAGAELDRISNVLKESGISANFTDTATMMLANHTAPKPVLEEFIRKANGALSFLMLRSDPLNAVNNGIGHTVLYGAETRDLVKNIIAGNKDAAGELALLSQVKIPGESLGSILSPTKLAANAYADYAKLLTGAPESKQLEVFFRANNWMPNLIEQERSIMNAITLRGTESPGQLAQMTNAMTGAVKTLASPLTKLNQGVEDMNRFVSAHTAKQISDIAVKRGLITEGEQLSYINTFVNRTNGNYIANQRPMLFQGPLGQAVGLFQTYQFNMMQQLFRYVGESGANKSAQYLLGFQGTIYGMNGLPGFNAINTHIVGNAAGNPMHTDIISQSYETAGKAAGDWLVYGSASQMFLHPDLKVNLYSRGEINPRQVTVIPTNPADVPIIGAFTKMMTSIKTTADRLDAGGAVYQTMLQGVEHAGISRPLAGLAQVAQAFGNEQLQSYSTTSKGSIIGANDLFSLTTFARMSGGRPLDEAIANDAVYRIRSYSAARTQEINEVGAALKSKIQAGTLDPESVSAFSNEYVAKGGKQEMFSKYMMRQMKSANTSTANQLATDLKNPVNQSMQRIMGGYAMQDLANIQ